MESHANAPQLSIFGFGMPHLNSDIFIMIIAAISTIVLFSYARGGRHKLAGGLDQLISQAHLERRAGNLNQEEYLLQKALEIMEAAHIDDVTKYSSCLVNLADCYTKQSKFSEAREAVKLMLLQWDRVVTSRDHTRMIDLDYFAATAEFGSGLPDVIDFFGKVIEAKKQMYGATHPEVANSMLLYSRLLATAGDKMRAEEIETEARLLEENG